MITLEKIDQIIERTGCTYRQARVALEKSEGDVLEAIIDIENNSGFKNSAKEFANETKEAGSNLIEILKEVIRKGNVTRLVLKREDKMILDVPVVAGAIGAVIFTIPTAISIVAAIVSGCSLQLVKEDGEIINMNEVTKSNLEDLKKKFTKNDSECCGTHAHHEHEEGHCGAHAHHEHEEGHCGTHTHHEHGEGHCGAHTHHEHGEGHCGAHAHHEHGEGHCGAHAHHEHEEGHCGTHAHHEHEEGHCGAHAHHEHEEGHCGAHQATDICGLDDLSEFTKEENK